MNRARLIITAPAIDARHSIAKVDLRDGAEDFVSGIRDHAQGDNHLVMTLP